jgi:NifB/MoaA-like Fe-S oxidoreductase
MKFQAFFSEWQLCDSQRGEEKGSGEAGVFGISPLYISVHATDTEVRNRLLGNRRAAPILDQLGFLKEMGISFHTQIVVCRGYNDGSVLNKTVEDLLALGHSLLSIAVVPVGLTKFRKFPLTGFDSPSAASICREIQLLSDRHAEIDGTRKLFLADEFFIRAG